MRDLEYREMLPDFLGIGAPRCGTTWLWKNLRQHPGVWTPPVKEIHYFDRSTSYPSPSFLASVRGRDELRRGHNKEWLNTLKHRIGENIRRPSWQGISWDVRFFSALYLGYYDDEWYASLFKRAGDKVKGEITAGYAALKQEDIEHIREIMPKAKIIYMIRNPIDRAWSAIRLRWWKREAAQSPDSVPPARLERGVERLGILKWGDYVGTINRWKSCFPEEQFFIGFFDDIVQNPKWFLSRVFEFLEVKSSEEHITQLAFKRINPSPQNEIPSEFRQYLANKYYPQIKPLSEMLGGHANKWLQDVERLFQDEVWSGGNSMHQS